MSEPVKINVNWKCRIKVRPRGLYQWNLFHTDLYFDHPDMAKMVEKRRLKPDDDGFVELQLWEVMNKLGPACYMGPEPPFDTEIEVIPE